MKKLLSASRPLGVINPWLRVVSGELHHHSNLHFTTNRRTPKIKQSLTTLNLSPMGESPLNIQPSISNQIFGRPSQKTCMGCYASLGVAG